MDSLVSSLYQIFYQNKMENKFQKILTKSDKKN